MGAIDLNRIGDKTVGWHITPENAQSLVDAFNAAASRGVECNARCYPILGAQQADGSYPVDWQMILTPLGGSAEPGGIGDWIVYEAGTAHLYRRGAMPDTFTGPKAPLEWDATTTAPTVEAAGGGRARLRFARPLSPSGPFSYGYLTQNMTHESTPDTISGDGPPTFDNGDMVVEFAGLVVGEAYRFAVQLSTQYTDGPVMSLPTDSITVTA